MLSATKDRPWANSRRGSGWNLGIAKQSLAAKEIRFRGGAWRRIKLERGRQRWRTRALYRLWARTQDHIM